MIAVEETIETNINEMPTLNHSYICSQIMRQLLSDERIEVLPELTLAAGNGITPDISIYPKEEIKPNFLEDITRFEKPPTLAIEIISPSQNIQDLLEKAKILLQAGSKTVWTVEPYSRTFFVTTAAGTKISHDTIVESDEIKVDFSKIFATDISLSA